ncbi:unnamed protein product, partial [Protopolystoma xenopodis]
GGRPVRRRTGAAHRFNDRPGPWPQRRILFARPHATKQAETSDSVRMTGKVNAALSKQGLFSGQHHSPAGQVCSRVDSGWEQVVETIELARKKIVASGRRCQALPPLYCSLQDGRATEMPDTVSRAHSGAGSEAMPCAIGPVKSEPLRCAALATGRSLRCVWNLFGLVRLRRQSD